MTFDRDEIRSCMLFNGVTDSETEDFLKRHPCKIRRFDKGDCVITREELSENIGYNYEWNMDKNQAVAVDTSETASIFPVSYDLRKKDRVGVIKNQGSTGTCWASSPCFIIMHIQSPRCTVVAAALHISRFPPGRHRLILSLPHLRGSSATSLMH